MKVKLKIRTYRFPLAVIKSYHKDNLRARELILAHESRLSPSPWNVKAAEACRDYSGYTTVKKKRVRSAN